MIESANTIMRLADSGVRIYEYLTDREISVDQAMTVLRSFGAATERKQASRRVSPGPPSGRSRSGRPGPPPGATTPVGTS